MPMQQKGRFYEFHAERVISRPGQPIVTVVGIEIGPEISQEMALQQLRSGRDIYTLNREDAYRTARSLHQGVPVQDEPHDEFYYPHFHPGGVHPELDRGRPGRRRAVAGPGHVFFGQRGEGHRLAG
jgi:hypothetical protein